MRTIVDQPDRTQAGVRRTAKMAALDGIINLNKPAGLSSAQALARVRKLLGQPKAGHAGTLDPLADGVLVVCLGRATRLVESLMEQPKIIGLWPPWT